MSFQQQADPVEYHLRWVESLPELASGRVLLRIARDDEFGKIADYVRRNREHLRPWEPTRRAEYFTDDYWRGAPARERQAAIQGKAYRFRIFLIGDETSIVGTVSLRDVVLGARRTATLGYSIDHAFCGRGLATEAAGIVLRFADDELKLKSVEATYVPWNAASARVLEKLGFKVRGVSRGSLRVNGSWHDQVIALRRASGFSVRSEQTTNS